MARLLRAGELTRVWAPDERHEAMRDLTRARSAAAADLRVKRQQTGAFLLRLGRVYPCKKTWGGAHAKWLARQNFAHLEQRIPFEELLQAMGEAKARVAQLERAIAEAVADWSLAPMVAALMAIAASISSRRRRSWPKRAIFPASKPADGVAGARAVRSLHRQQGQAFRHHQGER